MNARRSALIGIGALLAIAAAVAWRIYASFHPSSPRVIPGRTLVAAIGDSNTYGAGVLFRNVRRNSYPAQLERLLGPGHQVLNYGLSGRTLLDSGDSPYRAEPFFALSQEVRPSIVLIMLGTNDAKPHNWHAARYEAELRELVASYQSLENEPAVYLLTPPTAWPNRMAIDPDVVRDEVAPIVRRVATEAGVEVIDITAATAQSERLLPDGVHPNAAGYAIIAKTVHDALTR